MVSRSLSGAVFDQSGGNARPMLCESTLINCQRDRDARNPGRGLFGAAVSNPVWSKNSCSASIVLKQASEPVATLNQMAAPFGFIGSLREKELVAFALMIAFAVIMRAELGQRSGQRAFAKQNQLR
jgi:hypothetical protein